MIRDTLVPDEELQLYFNACDLVALPFRQVLNSGSLLLAMSFGCPVVAPRLGSIPEVACPEGWFGYDAANPDGLRSALRAALAARSRRAARGSARLHGTTATTGGRSAAEARNLYSAILGTGGPLGAARRSQALIPAARVPISHRCALP